MTTPSYDSHRCPQCGTPTVYQMMSGGREWYCEPCDTNGEYPADMPNPPRAVLLQTAEGREELRQQMGEELARRAAAGELT